MKAVFVTGVSRGIGLEIAKVFSKDGYYVYGSSRSNFDLNKALDTDNACLLYTSPSPRDLWISRMPSSA